MKYTPEKLKEEYKDYYKLYLEYYLDNPKILNISRTYNERNLRIGTEHNSYRVISHWEKNEIIDSNRPNNKGWRKYSFIEGVWLRIINKLRDFNFPLEKIRSAREILSGFPQNLQFSLNSHSEYPLLEYHIYIAKQKKPVILIVFASGELFPLEYSEYIEISPHLSHHLSLNLNDILIDFTKDKKSFEPFNELFIPQITEDDETLLTIIRNNDWSEMTLFKNDGNVNRIVKTIKSDSPEHVLEVINKIDYGDIHIKKRTGKIVHIQQDISEKL